MSDAQSENDKRWQLLRESWSFGLKVLKQHTLHYQWTSAAFAADYFGTRASKIWKEGQEDRPGQKCFMNKYADTFSIIG